MCSVVDSLRSAACTGSRFSSGCKFVPISIEAQPGVWGSQVAHLNFKMSRVGVYKCLSL